MCLRENTAGHEAARKEPGGRDAWLDDGELDSDRDHPAGVPDGPVDLGQIEQRVQHRPPFGNSPLDEWQHKPIDDVVRDRLTSSNGLLQVGAGPVNVG